jgi:hypothetical protein
MGLQYVRGIRLSLKQHPQFNERWVRDLVVSDPSILGLGAVSVIATERLQPGGGRLDLLLQQARRRFVVELMLGAIDESHIIRALEYWDQERRAHPEFDHSIVLVAEELAGRFNNVLRLLRKTLPLIGLQLTALRIADTVTVNFTRILGEPPSARETRAPVRTRSHQQSESFPVVGPTKDRSLFSMPFLGSWPRPRR